MSEIAQFKKATPDYIYLNTLLTCQLMMGCLDNLKETPYYKMELKSKANLFFKEIDRVMKRDIDEIYGIDDRKIYLLLEYVKGLIDNMSILKAEEMGIVNEIMNMLRKDPEAVLKALNIGLVESL